MAAQSTYTVDRRDVNFVLWEFLNAAEELAKIPKYAENGMDTYEMIW